MADFTKALQFLLRHEDPTLSGKCVTDIGGIARFGLNSGANPEAVKDGYYQMPRPDALDYASRLYRRNYWDYIGGDGITDQSVANQYFDMAVNAGETEATKLMQRAVNSVFCPGPPHLEVDGIPGLRTHDAINMAMPATLLIAFKSACRSYYLTLNAENPAKYTDEDLKSWLKRLDT